MHPSIAGLEKPQSRDETLVALNLLRMKTMHAFGLLGAQLHHQQAIEPRLEKIIVHGRIEELNDLYAAVGVGIEQPRRSDCTTGRIVPMPAGVFPGGQDPVAAVDVILDVDVLPQYPGDLRGVGAHPEKAESLDETISGEGIDSVGGATRAVRAELKAGDELGPAVAVQILHEVKPLLPENAGVQLLPQEPLLVFVQVYDESAEGSAALVGLDSDGYAQPHSRSQPTFAARADASAGVSTTPMPAEDIVDGPAVGDDMPLEAPFLAEDRSSSCSSRSRARPSPGCTRP